MVAFLSRWRRRVVGWRPAGLEVRCRLGRVGTGAPFFGTGMGGLVGFGVDEAVVELTRGRENRALGFY
jgi:hypothetical protein